MAEQEKKAIILDNEKKSEFFSKTAEHMVRFGGLANAGGALATITVLGATATATESGILNILAIPLFLFTFGVLCALLLSVEFFLVAGDVGMGDAARLGRPFSWIQDLLGKGEDALLVGMVAFFFLGCVSGVIIVALA